LNVTTFGMFSELLKVTFPLSSQSDKMECLFNQETKVLKHC